MTTSQDDARWQLAEDARRVARFPSLLAFRRGRMLASPHAFLRGSAPLFYRLLARLIAARPELAAGPAGDGWLIGDLHLENFGAYRCDTLGEDDDKHLVAFDLNDFDDALEGPIRFDVIRLLCSVMLAAQDWHLGGSEQRRVVQALLDGHAAALFGAGALPAPPKVVRRLVDRVAERGRAQLLAARTEVSQDHRRFVRGPRYYDLAAEYATPARATFAQYLRSIGRDPDAPAMRIVDIAQRIAGTGSLGCVRVAVLVHGKGGQNGQWIFDLKEEEQPSASDVCGASSDEPGARVVQAARRLPAQPPRMVGTAKLGELSMFCRRLAPQEDRIDLASVDRDDMVALCRYLGTLAGGAHRRGAKAPLTAWSNADYAALHAAAAELAGQLFSIYASYCWEGAVSG